MSSAPSLGKMNRAADRIRNGIASLKTELDALVSDHLCPGFDQWDKPKPAPRDFSLMFSSKGKGLLIGRDFGPVYAMPSRRAAREICSFETWNEAEAREILAFAEYIGRFARREIKRHEREAQP